MVGDMSREPSMEEILSSIRRVIARDEAAQGDAIEARFGGAGADADDAIDADADDADDILDLTDMEDAASDDAAPETPEAELISSVSAEATRQSLGQLTAALTQEAEPTPAVTPVGGMTIEALAEAALKPMLKEWLDANLPPLVERLVAREIARITGGRL
jgi:uncharacterized protein